MFDNWSLKTFPSFALRCICVSNVCLWYHYSTQPITSHRNKENTATANKLAPVYAFQYKHIYCVSEWKTLLNAKTFAIGFLWRIRECVCLLKSSLKHRSVCVRLPAILIWKKIRPSRSTRGRVTHKSCVAGYDWWWQGLRDTRKASDLWAGARSTGADRVSSLSSRTQQGRLRMALIFDVNPTTWSGGDFPP